jgi:hypothetical protein
MPAGRAGEDRARHVTSLGRSSLLHTVIFIFIAPDRLR